MSTRASDIQPLQRPAVTISYAQTLDGRLATRDGSSQWISGPQSLMLTHRLRAEHDAIMVGSGTILADNPRLTVRLVEGRDPLRVIVDGSLRTPLDANVLAGDAAHGTLLAVTGAAPLERRDTVAALGATIVVVAAGAEGHVDLTELMAALSERGVGSVMVEGGARLITALLRARLADRMVVTVAPKILGSGIDAVGDLEISALSRAVRMVEPVYTRYGDDMVIDGRVMFDVDDDRG